MKFCNTFIRSKDELFEGQFKLSDPDFSSWFMMLPPPPPKHTNIFSPSSHLNRAVIPKPVSQSLSLSLSHLTGKGELSISMDKVSRAGFELPNVAFMDDR